MAKAKDDNAALAEQIEAARAAAEAFIDAEAEKLKAQYQTLPIGTLRQQLTARGFGQCACQAAMNILNDGK